MQQPSPTSWSVRCRLALLLAWIVGVPWLATPWGQERLDIWLHRNAFSDDTTSAGGDRLPEPRFTSPGNASPGNTAPRNGGLPE
jgi:hypothetical protein